MIRGKGRPVYSQGSIPRRFSNKYGENTEVVRGKETTRFCLVTVNLSSEKTMYLSTLPTPLV